MDVMHVIYIYTCMHMYTYMCMHAICLLPGRSMLFRVEQCHIAKTHVHLFQWSSKASVDGIDLDSVSTLCRTALLIFANHLA